MNKVAKTVVGIAILALIVMVVLQLIPAGSRNAMKTDRDGFFKMISAGDVQRFTVIDNRKLVKVYLKEESIDRYEKELTTAEGKFIKKAPQFYLKIMNGEDFKEQLDVFYRNNPAVPMVAFDIGNEK